MPTAREKVLRYLQSFTTEGPGGCWLWRGSLDAKGYALASAETVQVFGTQRYAARWAMTLVLERPLPHTEIVMHTCRVPQCIRPDHLVITTLDDARLRARAHRRVGNLYDSGPTPLGGPGKSQA